MNAIDDAPQWRYPGGYQWFDADAALLQPKIEPSPRATSQPDFVLTTGLSAGTYESERYLPSPNLFLLFADTPDTKEGIRSFADLYGLLGLNGPDGAVMLPIGPLYGSPRKRALSTGELFSAWRREAREMRQAVSLWSALREAQSGDMTRLSTHIRWAGNNLVYYDDQPDRPLPAEARLLGIASLFRKRTADNHEDGFRTVAVIASEKLNPHWLKLFRFGDYLMPAKYYLQKLVNEQLKARVSPQLLWNLRRNRPDLALFFVPQNLLGLMWLQLAEAVNGNRGYRQCSACGTWMVITPEGTGSRSSRFTCSNACRMKVYYGRRVEARRLYQQGLPVREIARRLNTARQMVHGWVKGRKPPSQ
jgi:hypothetical protein